MTGILLANCGPFKHFLTLFPKQSSSSSILRNYDHQQSRQYQISTTLNQHQKRAGEEQTPKTHKKEIVVEEDVFDQITDLKPKPVTFVEGASYSVVILIGFGILGALAWSFISTMIIQPKEYKCFNVTLNKLKDDPRITVRVGKEFMGYGYEGGSRAWRQRIPNQSYKDNDGTEHIQIQFHISGNGQKGLVSADMYQDSVSKQWEYWLLYVDFLGGGRVPLIENGFKK
eukprot:TRINITY_DN13040_c0_g2_i1.p2 TRINITY_DN13040_c0_g2~~TRINITY_DN13040_c0_g2_i1.p2  ORF type:complete len:228 (-),score=29.84 TRINITY_DN13040_c0_g2_i1:299-982(-)